MKEIVSYASCSDYGRAAVRGALERLLPPFLPELAGKKVMIKPNLLDWKRPDDPACTHPALIAELCRFLLERGAAKVAVIENPAVQPAPVILERMGIAEELKELGVLAANCADYRRQTLPPGAVFHQMELACEYLSYDLVIDLPKAKTHAMMTLTLGVKNLFGLVRGSERLGWHLAVGRDFGNFADMLLDLHELVHPQLALLDSVIGMEGNGPGSGTPVQLGFLAASGSALALDAAVSRRLGVTDSPLLDRAARRNLLPEWEERGEIPAPHAVKLPDPPGVGLEWGVWLPPRFRKLLRRALISRPKLDPGRCVGCGVCSRMCPPHSLTMEKGRPRFHLKSCIRCYCCQEHCPRGAIRSAKTLWMHLAELGEKLLRKLAALPGIRALAHRHG